jgi:hypothetical protein
MDEAFQHRSHPFRSGICFGKMHFRTRLRRKVFSRSALPPRVATSAKLHLAGDDSGFDEFWADAKTARLISAGLLCNDAANLIHLPAYASITSTRCINSRMRSSIARPKSRSSPGSATRFAGNWAAFRSSGLTGVVSSQRRSPGPTESTKGTQQNR